MRKYIKSLITLLVISFCYCGISKRHKQIEVAVNKNVETVMIMFSQVSEGTNQVFSNQIPPLLKHSITHFAGFLDHPALQVMTEMGEECWLNGMIDIAVHCSPVPNAELLYPLSDSFVIKYSKAGDIKAAGDLIARFIAALNDFYNDADVESFMKSHTGLYEGALQEVRSNLPPRGFVEKMESYYGEGKAGFMLVPSPLMYIGIGFGPRVETYEGMQVLNVFGPRVHVERITDSVYGFDDAEDIERLTLHEFGHSFITPLVELADNRKIVESFSHLFEPIRNDMSGLGYDTWETVVKELLVRLGEIRITLAMGDDEGADRLRKYHIDRRKFVYLPVFEENILTYERNRHKYQILADYFPLLLNAFSLIDNTSIHK